MLFFHGSNYIIPLITFPYLVHKLGAQNIGLWAFSTATITYFLIFTDYGFNFAATKEISIAKNNKSKLTEIYSSVLIIKFGLMIVCFIFLGTLLFFINKYQQNGIVHLINFGTVLGQVIFPNWFFMGMEEMKYMAWLNLSSKILVAVATFCLVKSQNDLLLAVGLGSMGYILTGLGGLFIVAKVFRITFQFQPKKTLLTYFNESKYIFLSNLSSSLYTVSTPLLLGILTNNLIVGYYSIAEKITQVFKNMFLPVFQALYPFISKKISQNEQEGRRLILTSSYIIGAGFFCVSALLFLFSNEIILFLFGDKFSSSIKLLKILSGLPFLYALTSIYLIIGLFNIGKSKLTTKLLLIISIIHLILSTISIKYFGGFSAALVLAVTETIVTIFAIYFFNKYSKVSYS